MLREFVVSQKLTEVRTDSLKKYLQDIAKMPILSRDEEYKYGTAAATGDEKAIEILVTCNLRFVVSVAKIYVDSNSLLEDLINEGNEGLIIAARKFDPTRGFKFISYAIWWIRNRILDYKCNYSRPIRIPINKLNDISNLKKDTLKFLNENERTPDIEALELLGWDNNELKEIIRASSLTVSSLDKTIDDDGGTLLDVISNENIDKTDHLTERSDKILRLKSFLDRLNKQERGILVMLYGLNGDVQMTLTEVGEEYGLSRERIRQIRDKAILDLRIIIVKEKLDISFFTHLTDKE